LTPSLSSDQYRRWHGLFMVRATFAVSRERKRYWFHQAGLMLQCAERLERLEKKKAPDEPGPKVLGSEDAREG
jgi:hypothetical protein